MDRLEPGGPNGGAWSCGDRPGRDWRLGALQTIPGTVGCSFGDIAVAPSGAVVQACQNPTNGEGPATIFINTDTDGLGLGNFGAAVAATTTNVGGFDFIPAQNARSVDSEAGLAFDSVPASPHFGRLYLVYTDEVVDESNDTDIELRFSDDNGASWSAPIRVNDDPAAPIRSQFLPKIATNADSDNIAICWHDSRNSTTNTSMQEFCTTATPTGATPTFLANAPISDASSTSNGTGVEFGDYSGLASFEGVAHPIWGDTSNSTGDNPNGTANFDAVADRVTGEVEEPQVSQYAPIFFCGKPEDPVIAPGRYFTAINVHNPARKAVKFQKKVAIALPSEKPGKVTRFFDAELGPDEAFEIDCPDILKHARKRGFLKGFVIIEATEELDVVGVYSAAGSTGKVETLFIERSPARPASSR